MNNVNQFIEKVTPFFQKYGLFIAPALLFLLFMTLLMVSYFSQQKKSQTAVSIPTQTQSNTNNTNAPSNTEGSNQISGVPVPSYSTSPIPSSTGMDPNNDEPHLPVWTGATFSPDDFGITINQTTFSNGETEYSYDSNTPNRPDIIVVKNGVNIFERTVMYNIPVDTSISTSPDYIAKGSHYWGKNAETYIYLSKGLAQVIDTTNKQIVEEMVFEPESLQLFEQYDTDMIGAPQNSTTTPAP
jgi:hypothetical protein